MSAGAPLLGMDADGMPFALCCDDCDLPLSTASEVLCGECIADRAARLVREYADRGRLLGQLPDSVVAELEAIAERIENGP